MKAGLENIRELCARLGNPQDAFRSVHVVGSNGKGSVASMSALAFSRLGLRTGLFTSPHLVSVRERFRIDGEPVSAEELDSVLLRVRDASAREPAVQTTFFEAATAAALLWFAERGVDVAVLEAGLGGRLDSTNVADSPLAALTSISLEHTDLLGNTEEEILAEKLGVMRRGGLCVHALPPRLLPAAAALARRDGYGLLGLDDRAWRADPDGTLVCSLGGTDVLLGRFPGSPLPMQRNRVLAALLVEAFCARDPSGADAARLAEPLRGAFRDHVWPARLQFLEIEGWPRTLMDGAHNPESVSCLAERIRSAFGENSSTVVMGAVRDKNLGPMLDSLLPFAKRFLFVRTPYPRFRDPEELDAELCGRAPSELFGTDVRGALERAREIGDPVVVCGSLYLTGAAIAELAPVCGDLAWFRRFVPDANETR